MNPRDLVKAANTKSDQISREIEQQILKQNVMFADKRKSVNKKAIESLQSKIQNAKMQIQMLEIRNQGLQCVIDQKLPANTTDAAEDTAELAYYTDILNKYNKLRETQVDLVTNNSKQIDELTANIKDAREFQQSLQFQMDALNEESRTALNRNKAIVFEAKMLSETNKTKENSASISLAEITQEIENMSNICNANDTRTITENQRLKEDVQKLNEVNFTLEVEEVSKLETILREEEETFNILTTQLDEENAQQTKQSNNIISLQNNLQLLQDNLKTIADNIHVKFGINCKLNTNIEIENYAESYKQLFEAEIKTILQQDEQLQLKVNQVVSEISNAQKESVALQNIVLDLEEQIKQINSQIVQNNSENTNLLNMEIEIKEKEGKLESQTQEAAAFQDTESEWEVIKAEMVAIKADIDIQKSNMKQESAKFLERKFKFEQGLSTLTTKYSKLVATIEKGKSVKDQLIERLMQSQFKSPKSCMKSPKLSPGKRNVSVTFNDVVTERDITIESSIQTTSQVLKDC